MTRISIIIPSRLQVNPCDPGALWLGRAQDSIYQQTIREKVEIEVIVGLDPDKSPPDGFPGVIWAKGSKASQASALNAAVAASSGQLLAFLEDDDRWLPKKLEYGLATLEHHDLTTCNQREETEGGEFVRINDFPTPSGWMLRRTLWDRLGPFDEALRFHVDTEYLGRISSAGFRRLHLIEAGAVPRPFLQNIACFSKIAQTGERDPLVTRTVNTRGGMSRIASDPEAAAQSNWEHQIFLHRFGWIPW